jgi:hypothetical protein
MISLLAGVAAQHDFNPSCYGYAPLGSHITTLAGSCGRVKPARVDASSLLSRLSLQPPVSLPSCLVSHCGGSWPSANRDWAVTAGQSIPRLLNTKAPEFKLKTLAQDKEVALSDLLPHGPVVLQFADYS